MLLDDMDDIIIVGAGQAAAQCAESLRRKGFSGAVTLIGAAIPGRRLGSTSHGQLEIMATSAQARRIAAQSRRRQEQRAWHGLSCRSSRRQMFLRRPRRSTITVA